LQEARGHYPHILTIIITGYGSLESAIGAIRSGTYDYIQKPFKIEEIQIVTRNAIEKIEMLREKNRMLEELRSVYHKLDQCEADRESRPVGHLEDFSEGSSSAGRTLHLFPRHTLPLSLLETSSDEPNRVLTVLERLKDLRRQRIINDDELERLKKSVLDRMNNLSA
jgi:DNA-binding response OmpR family regulator